jgi:translation elongation factor EF-G
MKLRKIALLGLGCVLSLAITAGAVSASTGTTANANAQPKHKGGGEAIAQILGLDSQTLGQELKSGKTLAQIAAAKGIDTDTLKQKLESNLNDRLDKAIANGKFMVDGTIPGATSLDYHIKLASMTGGRGTISTAFAGYRECSLENGSICERRGPNPLDTAKYILYARNAMSGE